MRSMPPRRRGLSLAVARGLERAVRATSAVARLLKLPDVTAIFVANDQMALGLIHGLTSRGIRVLPRDISVVGFDDLPDSRHFLPPLTTVRQDFNEMGRRGLHLLLEEIAAGKRTTARATVPASLIVLARAPRATGVGAVNAHITGAQRSDGGVAERGRLVDRDPRLRARHDQRRVGEVGRESLRIACREELARVAPDQQHRPVELRDRRRRHRGAAADGSRPSRRRGPRRPAGRAARARRRLRALRVEPLRGHAGDDPAPGGRRPEPAADQRAGEPGEAARHTDAARLRASGGNLS